MAQEAIYTQFFSQTTCLFLLVTINFIFRLHLLPIARIQAQERKTRCEVPSVKPSFQTSLTCYFFEDINKTRAEFIVYHYTRQGDKDPVISCQWKKENLNCFTVRGYELDRRANSQVIITIPSALEEHEGTYSCNINTAEPTSNENCSFTLLKEKTSLCNIQSVMETKPTTLTCKFSIDVNVTRTAFGVSHNGREIIDCFWIYNLACSITTGYELENIVTDQLFIRVPRASREQAGTYICHTMGFRHEVAQPCEFVVTLYDPTGEQKKYYAVLLCGSIIPLLLIISGVLLCKRKSLVFWKVNQRNRSLDKIPEAVQMISNEKETMSSQDQLFWLQWVEAAFPDLDSRAYFLPPVYFNRVPMTRKSIALQDVYVLERSSVKTLISPLNPVCECDSDIKYDQAMQRVHFSLQKISKKSGEGLFGISSLNFEHYLGKPCYAAQLPTSTNLPFALPRNWNHDCFNVLLIHCHYGFVVCNVKSLGDISKEVHMLQTDIHKSIIKNLKLAISQLDKAEAMLSHLVSDIAPGLRITKTIAFPNLTARQVQQAISGDTRLKRALCRCLGISEPTDIPGLCLCRDQLSDPKTPCDVRSHVLRELGHWWQRRVAGAGPDSHMTSGVYKTLVSRFCGPATSVTVPCTCPPRVSVKTLGQAVWWTGECYTAVITLFPEQVHLLLNPPDRLFITGPPGTGKTVVLLLMAIEWLRCGHYVYIVTSCRESRAACILLYHLLLQKMKMLNLQLTPRETPRQVYLLDYDLEKAYMHLSKAAKEKSLFVIADEVEFELSFQTFCNKLLLRVPDLHLWAASCFPANRLAGWQISTLTRPLRIPPVVIREAKKFEVPSAMAYKPREVPDHTDGPPVKRLCHGGKGHEGDRPSKCITCGKELGSFLRSLRDVLPAELVTSSTTTTSTNSDISPPCLQWRDILVLHSSRVSEKMGVMMGLREIGIPVQVLEEDNIEDMATSCSDVVWVAEANYVCGLERKVIVWLDPHKSGYFFRFYFRSICTSQLVVVSPDTPADEE